MNEGDCVKVIGGEYEGQEGVISMIDNQDVHISTYTDEPIIVKGVDCQVIECPHDDNDIPF